MRLRSDGTVRLAARALVMALLVPGVWALAQPPKDGGKKDKGKRPPVKLGLHLHDAKKACQGYTLLSPSNSKAAYLLDMQGRVVHKWETDCKPGHSAYLLEDGHLLRAGEVALVLQDRPQCP